MKHSFFIRKTIFRLNYAGAKSKPQRFCHIAFFVFEKLCIPMFNFIPRNTFRSFYPSVFPIHMQPDWLTEIFKSYLLTREFITFRSLQKCIPLF